ncbi:MAG: WYL domain-containing protein [Phascolarctobacterium sp.]|nr:WYL domain-containing protein [Phascolarctobacterium sp.]
MAGYNELVKNFSKIRDYMREFFIYGYKTRDDYDQKSARSYDDARRRINSLLDDYVTFSQDKNGRRTSITISTNNISSNPFYAAYASKSFTDNDITLHFLLMEILDGQSLTADEIADVISYKYELLFETQTIRKKLKEYQNEGIFLVEKEGHANKYTLNKEKITDYIPKEKLADFLAFFSEVAPFGEVGNYLMQENDLQNDNFWFKHHYLAKVLDDPILIDIVKAIEEKRCIQFTNYSERLEDTRAFIAFPMKILSSVQNGRRFVLMLSVDRRFYTCFRLDYIKEVKLLDPFPKRFVDDEIALLDKKIASAWGMSVKRAARLDKLEMELFVDEEKEQYILERLKMEGRKGTVERLGDNHFKYTTSTFDAGEMLPWIKSFTGRVISVSSQNPKIKEVFETDIERMYEMYLQEDE